MKRVCLACQSEDIQYIPYFLIPKKTKKPNEISKEDFSQAIEANVLFCRKCNFIALEGISKAQVNHNIKIINNMLENPNADPSD